MPDPFITTIDLGNYLGRDVSADPGAVIATDAACNIIRSFADQIFTQVNGDQVALDGTGTDCLLLPEVPVTGAGTVVAGGGTLVLNTDYVLADQRKLIRTSYGSFTTTSLGDMTVWPRGRQNILVTYDHGYPGGTVPSHVRMLALQIASRITAQGIAQSETLAGQSITYATPALDPTPGERRLLRNLWPR